MQTSNESNNSNRLRSEISWLGSLLGRVIVEHVGEDGLKLVEEIRLLARDQRTGDFSAAAKLRERLRALSSEQIRVVIRAFAIFLDLANLAEDRQRVRVLMQRANSAYPAPPAESISDAVQQVLDEGGRESLESVLRQLEIDLVFTAHPTEAKRRTVRHSLKRLRTVLSNLDADESDRLRKRAESELTSELTALWQTDMTRDARPTVQQEAVRSLEAKKVIWKATSELTSELRAAVSTAYDSVDQTPKVRPFIRLGSWVGGDRDGHPFVTHAVTAETIKLLRREAIQMHLDSCISLIDRFTTSTRQVGLNKKLQEKITSFESQSEEIANELKKSPELEWPRRWLRVVKMRLQSTLKKTSESKSADDIAYSDSRSFYADVEMLKESCKDTRAEVLANNLLQPWLDQIDNFGFHLAAIDIRQNSVEYANAIGEIFESEGWCNSWDSLDEPARRALVSACLNRDRKANAELSDETNEVLNVFNLVRCASLEHGAGAFGGHVVSMTNSPTDILTVLWFWRDAQQRNPSNDTDTFELPIIPLFETIEDLQQAPKTMTDLLESAVYREHLMRTGNRQIIMVGYSDSTKDGGYLAANWALYEGQTEIYHVADQHNIDVIFFHGRGGSLGRGGGPAARAILSLPSETFHGAIRMTEQGEVLAERYDDPRIARRHLEQLTWASMLAALERPPENSKYLEIAKSLASSAFKKYRSLVEHSDFVSFFRSITPISEIETLQIGSRPSRRRGQATLADLRAIPWVFSWTQTRVLLPAWFGLGTAVTEMLEQDGRKIDLLQQAYQAWPYFRAMIDNAELALAKADMNVFRCYQELAEGAENESALREIASMIETECSLAAETINSIKNQSQLLEGISWLAESIRVRNRYIDPLNLIQVELIKRLRTLSDDVPDKLLHELQHLVRISIKGVAAGMRTTG